MSTTSVARGNRPGIQDVADFVHDTASRIQAAAEVLDEIHNSELLTKSTDELKRHAVCQALTAFLLQEAGCILKAQWPEGVS